MSCHLSLEALERAGVWWESEEARRPTSFWGPRLSGVIRSFGIRSDAGTQVRFDSTLALSQTREIVYRPRFVTRPVKPTVNADYACDQSAALGQRIPAGSQLGPSSTRAGRPALPRGRKLSLKSPKVSRKGETMSKAGAFDAGAELKRLGQQLCNWGKWGEADELGTLNYITPARRAESARLIETGEVFSLAIPLDENGPQLGAGRRFNPKLFMLAAHDERRQDHSSVADDILILPLQCATQWDSLAHIAHDGVMYGGRPITDVTTSGADHNSIHAISGAMVGRGVLLDIPRSRGLEALEPGFAIETSDLEECLAAQQVALQEGDILLVRTGFLEVCRRRGWKDYRAPAPAPGLSHTTAAWLHEARIAAVATDTAAAEVKPPRMEGTPAPLHVLCIVYMGLLIGEMFDFEKLAEHCSSDGRYSFMFVGAPLPVTRGLGSPVNPYAIK